MQLYEDGRQVPVHVKQFCEQLIDKQVDHQKKQYYNELESTCEEIMRKVIALTD